MDGLFNSELIFKKAAPHVNVFALYFKPKMLDALDATIDGPLEIGSEGNHYYSYSKASVGNKDDYKIISIDLRARYQVSPELSITTFNNISTINADDGAKLANGGLVGRKGASGWASSAAVKTVLWDCIELATRLNDTFTVMGSVGLLTPISLSKTLDDAGAEYSPEWRVTPAVQVYAASNASIYAGVAISRTLYKLKSADDETSVFAVHIPVVFRVKM